MDNKTLHDVLMCLELQREMIMKLYEFCEGAKEDRKAWETGERGRWQIENLDRLKGEAEDYIRQHDKQTEKIIKMLEDQITPKE